MATSAWRGGSKRSFVPHAIVTGIEAGIVPVNGTAAARIAFMVALELRNASMSPVACCGVTLDGLLTISA